MPKETLIRKSLRLKRGNVAFIEIKAENENNDFSGVVRELLDFAQKYYDRKDLIEKLDKKKK